MPGQGAASSYNLSDDGTLSAISSSVKNGETDSCWIAISNDGRYVYESNFISHSISSYTMSTNGAIGLLKGVAADTGDNTQAEDLGISADGKTLW